MKLVPTKPTMKNVLWLLPGAVHSLLRLRGAGGLPELAEFSGHSRVVGGGLSTQTTPSLLQMHLPE